MSPVVLLATLHGNTELLQQAIMSLFFRRIVLKAPGPSSSLCLEKVSKTDIFKEPLKPSHVRVRVAACAVAFRDVIDRTGGFPFMNQPTVLGHEFSGVVEESCPSSDLKVGDKVVSLHWAQFGGAAFPSPFQHKEGMKTFLGLTCDGGYADYVTCHETAFVKVPNPHYLTGVEAAPIMSTFGTVWQGAVVRGQLKAGEKVLVTGAAGGVGSSAVQMLSRMGAQVIGATGNVAVREQYIRSLGATQVVDSSKSGFSKALSKDGGGVDMVVECVGAPTFTESLRSLKPGGRLVLVGNVTNGSSSLPLGLCIVKSLSVIGTDSIEAPELVKLFSWLEDKKIKPVVDKVLSLEDVAIAHDMVEQRAVTGRIVLDINNSIW